MGLDTRIYVKDPKTDEIIVDELYYARKNWDFTRAVWKILEAGEEQNGTPYRLLKRDIVQIESWILKSIRNEDFVLSSRDYSFGTSGFYDLDDALSCFKAMLLAEKYLKEGMAVIFEADY